MIIQVIGHDGIRQKTALIGGLMRIVCFFLAVFLMTEKVRYGLLIRAALLFFAGATSVVAEPWQLTFVHAGEMEASP
jgi:hypothetical protein